MAPLATCSNGGISVDAGIDNNGNGILDSSEVTSTQYICNGTNGSSGFSTLVLVSNEPAGTNCIYGGKIISVGIDTNQDGVLGSSEVTSSNFICNGTNGTNGATGATGTNGTNSLIKITSEPVGVNCASGGLKITSGIDANNNGVLDTGEEGTPNYVCGGANGATGTNGTNGTNTGIFAPMGVVAAGADGKVVITWNQNPADMITSSNIYWSTNPNITRLNSTQITGATSPYTVTGLTNGTTYYFFATGVNVSGEGPASWPVSAIPGTPPSIAPANVIATPGNGTNTITWTASADASVIGYSVYRSLTPGVTAASGIAMGYLSATTTYVDYVNNGTAYYYAVTAVNGYGENVLSAEVSATPQGPPPAPQGFTATAGNGQVALSWTASPGATSYKVYDNSSWWSSTLVASPVGTTYTVTGLTNGNYYYYYVTAVNAVGESAQSNGANATPNIAPAVPTGVSAAAGAGQVTLSWAPVTGATQYVIYWSTTPGVTNASLNAVTVSACCMGGTSYYTHSGLINGTTYYYVVAAMNNMATSAVSAEVSGIPLAGKTMPVTQAATGITDTTANIAGSFSNPTAFTTTAWLEYGATTLYGSMTQSSTYAYSGNILLGSALSGLTQGTTYHYRVVTQNSAGTFYGNDSTLTTRNTPQLVFTGYSNGFAVDGTKIYFMDFAYLFSVPIIGGASTQLTAQTVGMPYQVDAANVYTAGNSYNAVTMTWGYRVNKIDKTTGVITALATSLINITSLAVDATDVYWIESNAVRKVNIIGTPVVTNLASGLIGASALAINTANVYWSDSGGIKTVAKAGGLITAINPSSGNRIVADASNIYWGDGWRVYTMGLTGGATTTLVSSMCGVFTMDTINIYCGNGDSIDKISIAGGPVTTVSYAPGGANNITVDATNVYWSNWNGIYKAPK